MFDDVERAVRAVVVKEWVKTFVGIVDAGAVSVIRQILGKMTCFIRPALARIPL